MYVQNKESNEKIMEYFISNIPDVNNKLQNEHTEEIQEISMHGSLSITFDGTCFWPKMKRTVHAFHHLNASIIDPIYKI